MSNEPIMCNDVRDQLALLLYGELSFDEEECVELHLDVCAGCRAALDRQKAMHAAIDDVEVTPSPALLARCREEFLEVLHMQDRLHMQDAGHMHDAGHSQDSSLAHSAAAGASGRGEAEGESWWSQVRASFEGKWHVNWFRPAGAVALLVMGFMAARLMPVAWLSGGGTAGTGANYSDLANLGADQIRNVQADGSGRVNIVLNETKQRTVSGNIQDAMIRNLLVAATKESADPGLRAETVTILVNSAGSADVRDALVSVLKNDQNTVVRWRAMEGLKSYTHDPAVQTALAQVLLRDLNPGMRTQAIDLLTSETGPAIDRQVVGVLQQMVSREDDAYVRERAQRMLEAVNASAGVY